MTGRAVDRRYSKVGRRQWLVRLHQTRRKGVQQSIVVIAMERLRAGSMLGGR